MGLFWASHKESGPNGTVLSESSESDQARKAVLPGGSGTPAHDPLPMKPLRNPAAWKDDIPQRTSHFSGQHRFPETTKCPALRLKPCHSSRDLIVPSLAAGEGKMRGTIRSPLPIHPPPFSRGGGQDFWRRSPFSDAPAPDSHGKCARHPASAAPPPRGGWWHGARSPDC